MSFIYFKKIFIISPYANKKSFVRYNLGNSLPDVSKSKNIERYMNFYLTAFIIYPHFSTGLKNDENNNNINTVDVIFFQ